MMWGITGTPGTGKTSIGDILAQRGYHVVHLTDTVEPYQVGKDAERDTMVIDVERWAEEFSRVDGIVEGHLAHYLACDRIVVLRCRPDIIAGRLKKRGYGEAKIHENVEAEAVDVILIETLERHPQDHIFELDTSERSLGEIADLIEAFIHGELPPSHGSIDWLDFVGQSL